MEEDIKILLGLAVDAHNHRPGCPMTDCFVCKRNNESGKRLAELAKKYGYDLRPRRYWDEEYRSNRDDYRSLHFYKEDS